MGDDLGSDDEYWMAKVSDSAIDSPIQEKETEDKETVVGGNSSSKKRKRDAHDDVSTFAEQRRNLEEEEDSIPRSASNYQSTERKLLDLGRRLDEKTPKQQALFLSAAMEHYGALASADAGGKSEEGHVVVPPQLFQTSSQKCLVERLKNAVSLKRMKKWKKVGSPMIVIVCLSARRAVNVLKEISSLKLRAAKLFPKNGSLSQQREQLFSLPFGIAVGTPHRLEALSGAYSQNADDRQPDGPCCLSWEDTQLLVLDCHLSNKQFTVCTLPDTAPHVMGLLRNHVLPKVKKRDNFRLAFF